MRTLSAVIIVALAGASVQAQMPDPRPVGIVYWGNSNTGNAVRVINKVEGDKLAEAEVKKIGGTGWSLLVKSNEPGFGAAMCVRKDGIVTFHTAHGYASGKEALAVAKAKASATGGMPWLCSRALWSVPQPASQQSNGVIDSAKGAVYKMVACEEPAASIVKVPPGMATNDSQPKPKCVKPEPSSNAASALPCTCVRG